MNNYQYYIQLPSNLFSLNEDFRGYLLHLASMQIEVESCIEKEYYLEEFNKIKKIFNKDLEFLIENCESFYLLKLKYFDYFFLNTSKYSKYIYHKYFAIPTNFLKSGKELAENTNLQRNIKDLSKDYCYSNNLNNLFLLLYQKYNTNNNSRKLFNSSNKVLKCIIDKHAMLNITQNAKDLSEEGEQKKFLYKDNKQIYCINPNLAKLTDTKVIETRELLDLLNINIPNLTKIMKKLKKLKYQFIIGGFGGAMTNFLYWLEEFCKISNEYAVIDNLIIYDNDTLDYSNLFRIPLDYLTPRKDYNLQATSLSKVNLAKSLQYCYKEMSLVNNRLTDERLNSNSLNIVTKNPNSVIIGSLDVESRFQKFKHFPTIIPLHIDNEVYIYSNMKEISSKVLIREQYGSIDLIYFFLNMIYMTYFIIEELVTNSDLYKIDLNGDKERTEKLISHFESDKIEFNDKVKFNYLFI